VSKTNKAGSHFQIKISLMDSPLPIWRRLLIDPEMSLELVHEVFQMAMGWWDCHLFEFRLGKRRFADVLDDEDKTVADATEFALSDLLKKAGDNFLYAYDFGDGWMHDVVLERRISLPEDDERVWAKCLHGKRACPPEDCFGVIGYSALLDAIEDPLHPHRKEQLEWLGCDFDPDSFDPRIVNLRLYQWEHEIKEEHLLFEAIKNDMNKEKKLVLLPSPEQKPKKR
jgi:hypothetical protein